MATARAMDRKAAWM